MIRFVGMGSRIVSLIVAVTCQALAGKYLNKPRQEHSNSDNAEKNLLLHLLHKLHHHPLTGNYQSHDYLNPIARVSKNGSFSVSSCTLFIAVSQKSSFRKFS